MPHICNKKRKWYSILILAFSLGGTLPPLGKSFKKITIYEQWMHFNTYLHWAVLLWTLQSQQVEEDEIYHKALQGDLAESKKKKNSSFVFME